jgi:hypothetical protein
MRRTTAGAAALVAAVLAGVLGAAPGRAACGGCWVRATPAASPPARTGAAAAYDPVHGYVLLFGGFGPDPLGDTWAWNGTVWLHLNPATSPSPRGAAGLAWDGTSLVLFGGDARFGSGDVLGDTWTWTGVTWQQASPAAAPQPRAVGASMAWDGAETVLFGGWDPVHGPGYGGNYGDTWTWDHAAWHRQSPAAVPPGRRGGVLAYDPARSGATLTGGAGPVLYDDAWTYAGGRWRQLSAQCAGGDTACLPSANGGGMAYDGSTLVAYTAARGETWGWDGTAWGSAIDAGSPSARDGVAVAYDEARKQIVLFGGVRNDGSGAPPLAETWLWTGPPRLAPGPSHPGSPPPSATTPPATATPSASGSSDGSGPLPSASSPGAATPSSAPAGSNGPAASPGVSGSPGAPPPAATRSSAGGPARAPLAALALALGAAAALGTVRLARRP